MAGKDPRGVTRVSECSTASRISLLLSASAASDWMNSLRAEIVVSKHDVKMIDWRDLHLFLTCLDCLKESPFYDWTSATSTWLSHGGASSNPVACCILQVQASQGLRHNK